MLAGAFAVTVALGATAWPASVKAEGRAEILVPVKQGWSAKQLETWYTLSQGSRLIPRDWLFALEQANSETLFLDTENIKKYRYLPTTAGPQVGLPLGFAIDKQADTYFKRTNLRWKGAQRGEDIEWVGMTCSACHTAEITYRDKPTDPVRRLRVAGGPTLADFQTFIIELNEALRKTRSDPDKCRRFAARVGAASHDDLCKLPTSPNDLLGTALDRLIEWQDMAERANGRPDSNVLRYGPGRLDAFGHIYNKVALAVKRSDGEWQRTNLSNAPVSYPFLWNVPQHDKVQWNGIAKQNLIGNYDTGALARNVGEVTGVFAEAAWFVPPPVEGAPNNAEPSLRSSAKVDHLSQLERLLKTLRPPLWPTGTLGFINDELRDRGRELFINKNRKYPSGAAIPACTDCHKGLRRDIVLLRPIEACMIGLDDIGTDPAMAKNAADYATQSGVLLNSSQTPLVGRKYPENAQLTTLLTTTVVTTILGKIRHVTGEIWNSFSEQKMPRRSRRDRSPCLNDEDQLLAYKARPLTGIWATAPYLHNGSVPTLYDLLLPPDQRPKSFPVGTQEFDKKRVGYVTRDADSNIAPLSGDNIFMFETRDAAGNIKPGNSNAGHDYGNALLSEEERWALVEYMKGL